MPPMRVIAAQMCTRWSFSLPYRLHRSFQVCCFATKKQRTGVSCTYAQEVWEGESLPVAEKIRGTGTYAYVLYVRGRSLTAGSPWLDGLLVPVSTTHYVIFIRFRSATACILISGCQSLTVVAKAPYQRHYPTSPLYAFLFWVHLACKHNSAHHGDQ